MFKNDAKTTADNAIDNDADNATVEAALNTFYATAAGKKFTYSSDKRGGVVKYLNAQGASNNLNTVTIAFRNCVFEFVHVSGNGYKVKSVKFDAYLNGKNNNVGAIGTVALADAQIYEIITTNTPDLIELQRAGTSTGIHLDGSSVPCSWNTGSDANQWTIAYILDEAYASMADNIAEIEFAELSSLEKFDLLEGATVVGPSEFAAPDQINAAIDAYKAVAADDLSAKKEFLSSENGTKLKNFKKMTATYGTLDNVKIEMKNTYATLIMSCPSSAVDGLAKYTCNADADGVLTLVEVTGGYAQFKPYIIKNTGEQTKFQIIGWNKDTRANVTGGYLTGPDFVNAPPKLRFIVR